MIVEFSNDNGEIAFFDTVKDRFVTFSDQQCWRCLDDFVKDFEDDEDKSQWDMRRFTRHFVKEE